MAKVPIDPEVRVKPHAHSTTPASCRRMRWSRRWWTRQSRYGTPALLEAAMAEAAALRATGGDLKRLRINWWIWNASSRRWRRTCCVRRAAQRGEIALPTLEELKAEAERREL